MPTPDPAITAAVGRALWRVLHAYAATYPMHAGPADQRRARLWLQQWMAAVPSDGCNCRGGWAELLMLAPPELATRDALERWATAAHDAVNAKLRRRLWSPQISRTHPVYIRLTRHWGVRAPR